MKPIEEYVRSIPDFPEPGIIFRDVTSVLQDADGLALAIDLMQEKLRDVKFDLVVGPESRGFIFGVPVAYAGHKSFVPVRKKESFRARRSRSSTSWSTVRQSWRSIGTRSSRDSG